MNEPFYAGTLLGSPRDGAPSPVPFQASLPLGEEWPPETLLQMQGQVRSYDHKMVEGAGRLMVTLLRSTSYPRKTTRSTGSSSVGRCASRRSPLAPSAAKFATYAGGQSRFSQVGLHSLHRLGPKRAVGLPFPGRPRVRVTGQFSPASIRSCLKTAVHYPQRLRGVSTRGRRTSSSPLPPKGFGDEKIGREHQAETVDSAKETGQAVPAPTC